MMAHYLNLFRIFFPSWKFFDLESKYPRVFFTDQSGTWVELSLQIEFRWYHLFFNWKNIWKLHLQTILGRVIQDLNEKSQEDLLTYFLDANYLQLERGLYALATESVDLLALGKKREFQFKIELDNEVVLVSQGKEFTDELT